MTQDIDQESPYDTLASSHSVTEAEKNGGIVVYPTDVELQLDLDSDEAVETFKANLLVLEQFMEVKHYGIGPSRSPGKYHATLELKKPVVSNTERILLQACLGSDPKRELLSYWRVLNRDPHPTLFIEGGTKPVVKKTELELNMVSEKPFNEVQPGDKGSDFVGEPGTVIATGTYDELKKYDSTGACDGTLSPLEKTTMVAVETESGDKLLFVYGPDGFSVWSPKGE